MSRKVHIVPCGDEFPWGKVVAAFLLVCGGVWTWRHVLVPVGHDTLSVLVVAGKVIAYGAMLVLAISAVLAIWFIVICLIERRRHGRDTRRAWTTPWTSPGMARQNPYPPVDGEATAPNPRVSTRPVTAPMPVAWDLDSEDKTFMFLHGIKPEDIK